MIHDLLKGRSLPEPLAHSPLMPLLNERLEGLARETALADENEQLRARLKDLAGTLVRANERIAELELGHE